MTSVPAGDSALSGRAHERGDARSVSSRRLLGAYYTPDRVALIVSRWALGGKSGTVLDPSYGGCSFLRMAIQELERLGCSDAPARVYGADVDAATAQWTAKLSDQGVPASNLPLVDFLSIRPDVHLPRCSAVLGNPPYVRHHWLSPEVMKSVDYLRSSCDISRRASVWAYFVLHAIDFVLPRGRLAMLLPGSVLQADYARAVRVAVERTFDHVQLVRIRERVFSDADEETVLLIGAGRSDQALSDLARPSHDRDVIAVRSVLSVAELERFLDGWTMTQARSEVIPTRVGDLDAPGYKLDVVSATALDAMVSAIAQPDVRRLDEVADVRIGSVTGSNHFFVLDRAAIPDEEGVEARPIIRKGGWLRSLRWTAAAHRVMMREAGRAHVLVVNPAVDLAEAPRLREMVEEGETRGIHLTSHCARRIPWWALRDVRVGEMLLPYMGAEVPRLVLNESRALCTNAVHRLFWKRQQSRAEQAGIVASSYTSLYGLTAELMARHYGGGVLKMEPSRAACLPVVLGGGGESALRVVERALHDGGPLAATLAADHFFQGQLGLTKQQMAAIRVAQRSVRGLRP